MRLKPVFDGVLEISEGIIKHASAACDIETRKSVTFFAKGRTSRWRPFRFGAQEDCQRLGRKIKATKIKPQQKSAFRFDQLDSRQRRQSMAYEVEIALDVFTCGVEPMASFAISGFHGDAGERVVLVDSQAAVFSLKVRDVCLRPE